MPAGHVFLAMLLSTIRWIASDLLGLSGCSRLHLSSASRKSGDSLIEITASCPVGRPRLFLVLRFIFSHCVLLFSWTFDFVIDDFPGFRKCLGRGRAWVRNGQQPVLNRRIAEPKSESASCNLCYRWHALGSLETLTFIFGLHRKRMRRG